LNLYLNLNSLNEDRLLLLIDFKQEKINQYSAQQNNNILKNMSRGQIVCDCLCGSVAN